MNYELITLKSFNNPADAYLLKSRLESEGIESYIFDENIGGMSYYNIATGGIKLKIRERDIVNVKKLLTESKDFLFPEEAVQKVKCPNCGSVGLTEKDRKTKGWINFMVVIAALFLQLVPFVTMKSYTCKTCGKEFRG